MRKVIAFACASALAFTLSGCSGTNSTSGDQNQPAHQEQSSEENSQSELDEKYKAAGLPTMDEYEKYRQMAPISELSNIADRAWPAIETALEGNIDDLTSLRDEASDITDRFGRIQTVDELQDLNSYYHDSAYNMTQSLNCYLISILSTDPDEVNEYMQKANEHLGLSTESIQNANTEINGMSEKLDEIVS